MTDAAAGPDRLVLALLHTISEEEAALDRLGREFARQLDDLRRPEPAIPAEALDEAGEAMSALGRIRATRERQMRLLGRVLDAGDSALTLWGLAGKLHQDPSTAALGTRLLKARESLQARARATRHRCEHLDFALRYVASLGRELMQAIQGLDAPAPPTLYTATGARRLAAPRRLVNRVG